MREESTAEQIAKGPHEEEKKSTDVENDMGGRRLDLRLSARVGGGRIRGRGF